MCVLDLKFILIRTFIYEPILMKIYMNTNIMKRQILYEMKYDLRGHLSSPFYLRIHFS